MTLPNLVPDGVYLQLQFALHNVPSSGGPEAAGSGLSGEQAGKQRGLFHIAKTAACAIQVLHQDTHTISWRMDPPVVPLRNCRRRGPALKGG